MNKIHDLPPIFPIWFSEGSPRHKKARTDPPNDCLQRLSNEVHRYLCNFLDFPDQKVLRSTCHIQKRCATFAPLIRLPKQIQEAAGQQDHHTLLELIKTLYNTGNPHGPKLAYIATLLKCALDKHPSDSETEQYHELLCQLFLNGLATEKSDYFYWSLLTKVNRTSNLPDDVDLQRQLKLIALAVQGFFSVDLMGNADQTRSRAYQSATALCGNMNLTPSTRQTTRIFSRILARNPNHRGDFPTHLMDPTVSQGLTAFVRILNLQRTYRDTRGLNERELITLFQDSQNRPHDRALAGILWALLRLDDNTNSIDDAEACHILKNLRRRTYLRKEVRLEASIIGGAFRLSRRCSEVDFSDINLAKIACHCLNTEAIQETGPMINRATWAKDVLIKLVLEERVPQATTFSNAFLYAEEFIANAHLDASQRDIYLYAMAFFRYKATYKTLWSGSQNKIFSDRNAILILKDLLNTNTDFHLKTNIKLLLAKFYIDLRHEGTHFLPQDAIQFAKEVWDESPPNTIKRAEAAILLARLRAQDLTSFSTEETNKVFDNLAEVADYNNSPTQTHEAMYLLAKWLTTHTDPASLKRAKKYLKMLHANPLVCSDIKQDSFELLCRLYSDIKTPSALGPYESASPNN